MSGQSTNVKLADVKKCDDHVTKTEILQELQNDHDEKIRKVDEKINSLIKEQNKAFSLAKEFL